ncbi:hypothetical protein GGP41_010475 [Bipolaris sorokiniana]|uniref:Uncharacterized protein n=1 Tax=Cochliobolus sativus TaxID=45130 RepID=A0A8H5ZL60_COCSA|nr:hypothetical protein GGP41_010475 [Bipolaris sorokiniana]
MPFLLSLLLHFLKINGTAYIAPSESIWALLNQFLARLCITSIAAIRTTHKTRFHIYFQDGSPMDGNTDANVDDKIITSTLPTKMAPGESTWHSKYDPRRLLIVLVPKGSYEIFMITLK